MRTVRTVSRPRSLVRDVCPWRAPLVLPLASGRSRCECDKDETFGRKREKMAVSQPRPPDRVDAALEKVAPLRYLEAHECARAESIVTRYYL